MFRFEERLQGESRTEFETVTVYAERIQADELEVNRFNRISRPVCIERSVRKKRAASEGQSVWLFEKREGFIH